MSTNLSSEGRSREGPDIATSAAGRVLAGRYELVDRVGQGGTAEVFRALDHRLDRVVAVKILRREFGQDANARTRFAVEARSAAGLNAGNIVPVYDFGASDDGSLFIVMRYIDGPSLRRVLALRRRLPLAAALDVGRQVAEALAEAHARGLVHRDVKPGNILIDRGGTAHLTDFGTVKALEASEDLTRSGTIFGTAAYLSPEQATGGRIGAYTDMYALGVVLYEALSGAPPFRGDDPVAVSYRHAHELPRPLADHVPGVDAQVNDLVMACLAKDPARRPRDAAQLASALDVASRRLAPRGGGTRLLAEIAAAVGTGIGAGVGAGVGTSGRNDAVDPAVQGPDPEKETLAIPLAAQPVAVATQPRAVRAFAPPPSVPPPMPRRFTEPDRVERGVVAPRGWERERQRRRSVAGPLLLLAVLAVVALGAALGLAWLLSPRDGDRGTAIGPTPTATERRARRSQPVVTAPPAPTIVLTPIPITPPPPATLPPITLPPQTQPPPPPPPPPGTVAQEIPDSAFAGDFDGDGTYHDRSASWIYGQGTAYNTMTAGFTLQAPIQPGTRASIELVGLDGENRVKNAIRVVLNGATLYEGPNPLPDDFCCGGSGPGNWGSVVFEFPAELLGSENSLSITNLEPSACTSCPKFVMLDYATVTYSASAT